MMLSMAVAAPVMLTPMTTRASPPGRELNKTLKAAPQIVIDTVFVGDHWPRQRRCTGQMIIWLSLPSVCF